MEGLEIEKNVIMQRYLTLFFMLALYFTIPTVAQTVEGTVVHPLHVVILGDSNTWIGGDDCDKPKGWNKWFGENVVEDIAVLGNDNVIYNQIARLKRACDEGRQQKPDLIIIAAGTNDAWFVKQRPKVFAKTAAQAFADKKPIRGRKPNEVLSLAESVRYGCELLMERFPEAQIILLTPLQAIQPTKANLDRASDIIEQCGRRMGLEVVRQDRECCVRRADEQKTKRYTTDGAHTSEEGARLNGTYLAKRISELLHQH